MNPCVEPIPAVVTSQPPMTPPTMPMTMFGRQPRAVRPPTSAPEMAPANSPTTIQPRMSMLGMALVWHGRYGHVRKASTAATNASGMGVVGGVAGALDEGDPPIREARSPAPRSPRGRPAGWPSPRIWRTGCRTAPRASSEAAGSSFGIELAQDRAGRGRAERPDRVGSVRREGLRRTCPTTSAMNIARAPSRSPASSRSLSPSSMPAGW